MGSIDDWQSGRERVSLSRLFEYTEEHLKTKFQKSNDILWHELTAIPCLFMQEGVHDQVAYIGHIHRARVAGNEVAIEFTLDRDVPPLRNSMIYARRADLSMPKDFEFSRNHWAVKEVDLYRFLLNNVRPRRQLPRVFQIPEHEAIDPVLVSVMMPFDLTFTPVYQAIQAAADAVGLRCRRADDIWENPSIIQDVVALIDRSRIVVCDCTGRNPNVFYEAGIAHTLGREVILVTQNGQDVPFDLRHLRYVPYLNNEQGRHDLQSTLQERMQTILGH
jgi:hypothetical protein